MSDKLRGQVATLKKELQRVKETHRKALKAAHKTQKVKKVKKVKMTDEEKGQRKREKAVTKELVKMKPLPAQAEPMMPAPAPSLAPALPAPAVPKGGRRRRTQKRPVMRW